MLKLFIALKIKTKMLQQYENRELNLIGQFSVILFFNFNHIHRSLIELNLQYYNITNFHFHHNTILSLHYITLHNKITSQYITSLDSHSVTVLSFFNCGNNFIQLNTYFTKNYFIVSKISSQRFNIFIQNLT